MIITVEISHYPLIKNYERPILNFIHAMKSNPGLIVKSNAMSTQVKGEMREIFSKLQDALELVYDQNILSSTVIKIINKDLPIENGHLEF